MRTALSSLAAAAGDNPFLVSLPMSSADNVRGKLTTYIDFDSPLGTDIYKAVSTYTFLAVYVPGKDQ